MLKQYLVLQTMNRQTITEREKKKVIILMKDKLGRKNMNSLD